MTLQPFVERARRPALVAETVSLFTFAAVAGESRLGLSRVQVASVNVEALGPNVGERLRIHAERSDGQIADARVHRGTEGRDDRVLPIRRLVSLLQDSARGAARLFAKHPTG